MKKKVLLTGATGTMGWQAMIRFLEHKDELDLTVFARPSEVNKEKLAPYADQMNIIWGDLNDYDLVSASMKDMDYVCHVGAIIPPMATEAGAEYVMKTNYGSTLAMLRGIKQFGQEETTHYVYIGTVEEVGHRAPPMHWGRIGDPLQPSVYCYYALSKVASERAVAESGLKYWASVRQSFQNPTNPIGAERPIMAMQAEWNCAEHMDAESSGNLVVQICLNAPDEFWGSAYNLGGGEGFRSNYYTFLKSQHGSSRAGFHPKWIAHNNFHGHFFLDSDKLHELVPYRLKTGPQFLKDELMHNIRLAKAKGGPRLTPEQQMEKHRQICSMPGGTIDVVERNDIEAIKVLWGSVEKFNAIPDSWDDIPVPAEPGDPILLDHGYDETKPVSELDLADMQKAAEFRGGKCLSESMEKGAMMMPLRWKCALGHEFEAKPNTILKLGHWCPECLTKEWNFYKQAEVNPFFAQSWDYLHEGEEPFSVKMLCDATDIDKLFE